MIAIPLPPIGIAATSNLQLTQRDILAAVGTGFPICVPVLYVALGLIGGVISAAIYNLAAK